ncbi:MAG: hypothetical protein N2510_08125, partial [Ignavibacteria bacterium]|nr:hypothetical protein [Ignavibacteria bacterium]
LNTTLKFMKFAFRFLYLIGFLLLITSLLGGSLTDFVFRKLSEATLERAGLSKVSVDSLDNNIDEIFYSINKIKFRIDKIRELFGGEATQTDIYKKQKNQLIFKKVYNPVMEITGNLYRFALFILSVCLLLAASVIQLIHRSSDLRKRVEKLERIIQSSSIPSTAFPDR